MVSLMPNLASMNACAKDYTKFNIVFNHGSILGPDGARVPLKIEKQNTIYR